MLKKTEIKELANKALESGNPYRNRAIKYFLDTKEMYIYAGQIFTREQIDNAYLDMAMKDVKFGFDQRMVGYYDKWYRYNRADEGRAYDIGVRRALEEEKCVAEMRIIECMA